MKKFLILFLLFLIPCTAEADLSNGQDSYVRRDVYQSDMRNINEKLEKLDKKLDDVIDKVNNIDVQNKIISYRVADIRNVLYIVLFIVIASSLIRTYFYEPAQKIQEPSFTLDDVKKLIEENNAMLLNKLQGGAI